MAELVGAGVEVAGSRILVTGVTGQVAEPLALALSARGAHVIGIARFGDAAARSRLEDAGVETVAVDLARPDFDTVGIDAVPRDVDYVCHLAVVKSNRWEVDLRANGEALGLLMARCSGAKAFLHCSSTAVYQPAGTTALTESAPLGDNHRVLMETYSLCKVSAEVVARTGARLHCLPTTIARLNVPYGDGGGWPGFQLAMIELGMAIPVHPDRPNVFNPIHDDDIADMVPRLLAIASVPATIVNWGGSESVSLEEWCTELGRLVDRPVTFDDTQPALGGVHIDVTRMHELVGRTSVDWRDGMARLVAAAHPDA